MIFSLRVHEYKLGCVVASSKDEAVAKLGLIRRASGEYELVSLPSFPITIEEQAVIENANDLVERLKMFPQ